MPRLAVWQARALFACLCWSWWDRRQGWRVIACSRCGTGGCGTYLVRLVARHRSVFVSRNVSSP